MTTEQNALEYVKDKMQLGVITSAQANVLLVQMVGVKVISGSLPASVRKALNDAVKSGELGKLKKGRLRPEIYHHKNARPKAIELQNKIFSENLENLKTVTTNL